MSKKFVISSPSASGKTTLVNAILSAHPEIYRLKTCTTRPIRPEETGDEYYFLTQQEANEKINAGEFVEHSNVYGNIYGLTKHEVDSHLITNSIVILDVQGATKFKKIYPDALMVFIEPPPLDILETRLNDRNTSDEDVSNRLAEITEELSYRDKYDCILQYDTLLQMKRKLFRFINFYIK